MSFNGANGRLAKTCVDLWYGEAVRRAKETVRSIYQEASAAPGKDDRKALAAHAERSEAKAKIGAFLSLTESEPEIAIMPDELDRDPMLLNCSNGTIDLKNGELRPHDRYDFITRKIPVEYDPEALCPLWDKTLDEIFPGKPELVDFLQRAVGYSLTGHTTEQVVFLLWGSRANVSAKSVTLTGCWSKKAAFCESVIRFKYVWLFTPCLMAEGLNAKTL